MLYSLDFRSAATGPLLDYARTSPAEYKARRAAKDRSVRLIVDHAVPVDMMVRMMFDHEPGERVERTAEGIRVHLTR